MQPGERFIRMPEVMSMTGLKTSTIYRLQAESQFPQSIPLPGGRRAWLESEIRKFMQERVALREAAN
ncbi:MAG: AlpA family phage regulatory protein [Pseudomonadota bacterium]|nr:AlpA family phage regulatory protein [Pseudomonadota bacterium]